MIRPLIERIFIHLAKEKTGTDDYIAIQELKRSFLTFLSNIFNSNLDFVLLSEGYYYVIYSSLGNLSLLPSMLNLILNCFIDYTDTQTEKIASALIIKIILAWGVAESPQQPTEAGKQNRIIPGFDAFINDSIVPVLFDIPLQNTVDFTNSQNLGFLYELSSLHKVIYQSQKDKYASFLRDVVFPRLGISLPQSQEFIGALSSLEPKAFKKYFQVSNFYLTF
jgi:exportin-T